MRLLVFIFSMLLVTQMVYTQDSDTTNIKLSAKEAQKLMEELDVSGQMKNNLLNNVVDDVCKCIDSIIVQGKGKKEIALEIHDCIDNKVIVYQTSSLILKDMKGQGKNNIIQITTDKNSKEYITYYREIERKLRDTCERMQSIVASDNKESKYSFSKNEEAMKQYNFGAQLSEKGIYEDAIPFYKKAVELDPLFTFAWDNLGVCYRNTKNFDKAIEAYKKSLAINPYGVTPLQNIAVAYEFKGEYDKAIEAYEQYLEHYPDGEEAYYGLGRQYMFYKKDYEKALENLCQAYNLYVKMKSPYRVDAEKLISSLYGVMKEKKFNEILKKYNIKPKK